MSEKKPYGFWWANEPENSRPNAWCSLCNELVAKENGEWTDEVLEVAKVKLLCGCCYDEARKININE